MAQQLGVILTPFGADGPGFYAELGPSYGGRGTYLPQPGPYPLVDRFHNTRGEVGWYYDSQLGRWRKPSLLGRWLRGLGAIPTDAELAKEYVCYTPVASGEIPTANQGFLTPPWRFGWDPAGSHGPPPSLSGAIGDGATAADAVLALKEHQAKMFWIQVLTATAVSVSALIASYRQLRLIKRDFARKRSGKR
jgi:hypothetical protein